MRYLISARHGTYDKGTGDLTSEGKNQINNLADAINKIIDSNTLCLVSTLSKRVVQTAEILQQRFGISDYSKIKSEEEDAVFNIYPAKESLYYAMIFVSHAQQAVQNPAHLAKQKDFSETTVLYLDFLFLGNGEAICLDLEQKCYTIIPVIKKVIQEARTEPQSEEELPF